MTTFDGREQAFENKFAHDAELEFKIMVRRDRLFGEWVAGQLGLSGAAVDAYAQSAVRADLVEAGDDDILGKVTSDLTAAGVEVSDHALRKQLADAGAEARRQIMAA